MNQILARIYILHIYETLKKLKNKTSNKFKKKRNETYYYVILYIYIYGKYYIYESTYVIY